MFEIFERLGIETNLLQQASIPVEQYDFLLKKLQSIAKIKGFLLIEEPWQLELLMGDVELFKNHAHQRDSKGYNVSHYAALSGNTEVMEWIKEWNENYFYLIEGGQSKRKGLAFCGVLSKNIAMLDWLWNYNKDWFKEVDSYNDYVIANLIATIGWFEGIKWISEHVPELLTEKNKEFGDTPLEKILNYCSLEVLDWLKLNNRNVLLQRDDRGFSIAHMAARMELIEVLRWILANEPELMADVKNEYKFTLLESAALSGNKEILDFCFNFDCKQDIRGKRFVLFALSSLNPRQLNYALSLSDSPEQIQNIFNIACVNVRNFQLLNTLNTALETNISLQSITYIDGFFSCFGNNAETEKKISKNIQEKIYRNIEINKIFNEFIQKAMLFCFKLNQKSNDNAGLLQEICYEVCNVLFNVYLPTRKNYNFDSTFFSLAREPILNKQDKNPDLISKIL